MRRGCTRARVSFLFPHAHVAAGKRSSPPWMLTSLGQKMTAEGVMRLSACVYCYRSVPLEGETPSSSDDIRDRCFGFALTAQTLSLSMSASPIPFCGCPCLVSILTLPPSFPLSLPLSLSLSYLILAGCGAVRRAGPPGKGAGNWLHGLQGVQVGAELLNVRHCKDQWCVCGCFYRLGQHPIG